MILSSGKNIQFAENTRNSRHFFNISSLNEALKKFIKARILYFCLYRRWLVPSNNHLRKIQNGGRRASQFGLSCNGLWPDRVRKGMIKLAVYGNIYMYVLLSTVYFICLRLSVSWIWRFVLQVQLCLWSRLGRYVCKYFWVLALR